MARAYTSDECREMFLDHVAGLVRYWSGRASANTIASHLGLAHSILALIDGENGGHPPMRLLTNPHYEDQSFCFGRGENWYPSLADITEGVMLHERFSMRT